MKDDRADLAAIVSLIYETVFAPKGWGHLVGDDRTIERGDGALEKTSLQFIVPFLEQALASAKARERSTSIEPQSSNLLDELPLPVCIVSRDLRLLSATKKAYELLKFDSVLSLSDGHVLSVDRCFQDQLNAAIASAMDSTEAHTLSWAEENGLGQTFLVAPISWGAEQSAAALFLNIELGVFERLSTTLIDAYGLTTSEATVTSHLAQGLSIDEISDMKGVSINTVRTQLKSVFVKTGTNRQGELVSLVLNGPAVWLRLVKGRDTQSAAEPLDAKNLLTLSDGRELSYGDYGPELGTPIFVFHHLMGSRNEKPSDEESLRRLDVRLIVPERPGIGRSTPMENRRFVDWADDVRQLADHLHIHRFRVLGFSTGGPHGAACAALLGDRVIKLALVASAMPVDELPDSVPMGLTQRFLAGMTRHWPSGVLALLTLRYEKLFANLDREIAGYEQEGNAADIELLRDPVIRKQWAEGRRKAADVPKHIFASELVLLFQPWGFRMADLDIPVQIWHGRQDDFFPADYAEAMSSLIPDCHAVFSDEWGHFFLYREWERVLAELVG